MHLPRYQLTAAEELFSYEFISEGPKGLITKRIQFTLVNLQGIYNLGFGDKNPLTGEIDDKIISDNGDREKILSTVVSAVFTFLDNRPGAWVFASGSTTARTRLYQMGISRYLDYISEDLEIYGQLGNEWRAFKRNTAYEAFLTRLKSS